MTPHEVRLEKSLSTKKFPVSNVGKIKSSYFSKNHSDLQSHVTKTLSSLFNRSNLGLHFIRSQRPPKYNRNTKTNATKIANFEKFLVKFKNSPKFHSSVFGHRNPTGVCSNPWSFQPRYLRLSTASNKKDIRLPPTPTFWLRNNVTQKRNLKHPF